MSNPAKRTRMVSPFSHLNRARSEDTSPEILPPDQDEDEGTDAEDETENDTSPQKTDDEEYSSEEEQLDQEDQAADEEDEKEAETDDQNEADARTDARIRERSRCAAIFRRPEAANNLALAAHLAFNTDLSRIASVQALQAAGKGRPQKRSSRTRGTATTASLRNRMQSNPVRPVRTDSDRSSGGKLMALAKAYKPR